MPTDIAFRLSTYLSLAFACATLGYAEWDLLPEASICSFIVGGLMILTFSQEGKWELSLTAANRLGLVIGILAAAWIAFQIMRPSGGLIYKLPWPAGLLPYIGPLIMVLMPAKLFRPKHVGDWWTMHGVGLAAVALSCTLADDLTHGVLVTCYFICGAWSLSLFYLRRAAGGVPLIPGRVSHEPRSLVVTGDFDSAPKTLLGRAFAARPVWALVAAAGLGSIFFFITPRIEGPVWNLQTMREVGYNAEDSAPDLNKSGSLATQNREIAFTVQVKNADGSWKDDLPSDQLWRGRSFSEYRGGKWQPQSQMRPIVMLGLRSPQAVEGGLNDYWTIDFEWRAKRRDAVLASPVFWRVDRGSPVASDTNFGKVSWTQSADSFFFPITRDSFNKYRQISRQPVEDGLGPLFEFSHTTDNRTFEIDPYREHDFLVRCDIPAVRDYSLALLNRLIDENKLPSSIRDRVDPISKNVAIDDHERVAFVIRKFIAESGEFVYDAEAKPPANDRDPIEDFLLVSKTGTCERFATAMAMILRSLGIPCRIVVGFKGCEQLEEGRYVIRQEHAHAWCEMLVRRPTPVGFPVLFESKHVFAWLNQDPTPNDGGDGTSASTIGSQVRSFWQSIGDFFSSFISKYDPEQRERMWTNFIAGLKRWWPVVIELIAIGGVLYAIWRLVKTAKRNRAAPVKASNSMPEWYTKYLELAARRNVERKPSETPIEHAKRFAEILAFNNVGHPQRIATAMTAYRYGGVLPDEQEIQKLLAELDVE